MATQSPQDSAGRSAAPPLWIAVLVVLLIVVGGLGIGRDLSLLWHIWTTDPLRSIGMLIPPVSLALTLAVWRRFGGQLRGSWWGLLAIALSFALSIVRLSVLLLLVGNGAHLSLVPLSLPVFLYGFGIALLFAGPHLCRAAGFPLGLLLLSQPVPMLSSSLIDLPLQNLSAHVARSFATLIHFAPTTPQLRLMFSPDFGMFIAPGCDGIRGAVALGYIALVLGYLKRFSLLRWAATVAGGVLLGYLFNFIRLCVLVVYYRIALGHPRLEDAAKQADFAIGTCLFLVAILIFLRLAQLRTNDTNTAPPMVVSDQPSPTPRGLLLKCTAFAAVLLLVLVLPSSVLRTTHASAISSIPAAERFPKQIGAYTLTRAWSEQAAGQTLAESAAYSAPGSDEVVVSVWVASGTFVHDANACWVTRGIDPEILTTQSFALAGSRSSEWITGYYSDGITDDIVVSTNCTPELCSQAKQSTSTGRTRFILLLPKLGSLARTSTHPVPILLRIDRLHSAAPKEETHRALAEEARQFLAAFDPYGLSLAFQ